MKSLTEYLWFEVPGRRGFVNITETVEDLVLKSGVNEGIVLCNAMHITASVFINDNEEGCCTITRRGRGNSRRMRRPCITDITGQEKTTPTRI